MDVLPAELLVDGIPAAGFVLSLDTTIIASNKRAHDLIGLPLLNGRYITSLPIVLIPLHKPIVRDWDSLFRAARSRLEADSLEYEHHKQHISVYHQDDPAPDNGADTAAFWGLEDRKELAMTHVHVHQRGNESNGRALGTRARIHSRMCIRAIKHGSDLRYIVTFRRPLDIRQAVISSIPFVSQSETPALPIPEGEKLWDEPLHRNESVTQIVSKIIPSCIAIADETGQMIYMSQSWYDFSGLAPNSSLGAQWAEAVHAGQLFTPILFKPIYFVFVYTILTLAESTDDIVDMMIGWAEVVSQSLDNWTWEARYRNANGEYIYFLVRTQSVKDGSGMVRRYYVSMLDVNDLVLARKESDLQRRAVMTLLSQADVSLWGIDQDRHLYVREGKLPWDPLCLPPSSSHEALKDEGRHAESADLRSHNGFNETLNNLLNGLPFQSSLDHEENGRSYSTCFIADPKHEESVDGDKPNITTALGLTIDVTDMKVRTQLQIDNELLGAKTRAASEASELKSRFLANMSHEIRTPIAGIIGLNDILHETVLTTGQKQLVEDTKHTATYLLALVNDILDFSKIEAGHMDIEAVPFSLSSIVNTIEKLIAFGAREKNLSLTVENNLPYDMIVEGDSGRLQQILTNLLSNGVKFTQTGSVSLSINRLNEPTPLVNANSMQNSDSDASETAIIQFTVVDTGCGIDKETMTKLFHPFIQADSSTARKFGGTGLGLTISRQLAELMNGTIELTSEVSIGSTAILTLPYKIITSKIVDQIGRVPRSLSLSEITMPALTNEVEVTIDLPQAKRARVASSSRHKLPLTPENSTPESLTTKVDVLVVEDNAINQKIALLNLKRLGYTAKAVWNGQEAIDHLEETSDVISLPSIILLDLQMPVRDGYETTEILRGYKGQDDISKKISTIPIIAMTASSTKGDRERCQAVGMSDYLSKPVVRADLQKMLVKWIGGT